MSLFRTERGRVIRLEDSPPHNNQPLRTKIVATIGSETSYADGIQDLDGRGVSAPTYDYIVTQFYENGADVIRLNLSHIKLDKIEGIFAAIKAAVRACERENNNRKRVALLADLPGPKIRFALDNYIFHVGDDFTVHFETERPAGKASTVYVDAAPLKMSLEKHGRHGRKLPQRGIQNVPPEVVENVLAKEFTEASSQPAPFKSMMNQINRRIVAGERVLAIVGDGDVFMEVNPHEFDAAGSELKCRIVSVKGGGGAKGNEIKLNGNKGFSLKNVDINVPSFTDDDRSKLDKLLELEYSNLTSDEEPIIAFVALSFAQTANDVLNAKEYIERTLQGYGMDAATARLKSPSIIAKIETNKGWENIDFILDVADGVMVARGDLGLQMDIEEVPAIQKKLIQLCNKRGKPVITATEMLKSMTKSIEPTRAEGTDVFNAIVDGSDAVMMSEETSAGQFPFHSIRKMISIAVQAERYFELKGIKDTDLRQTSNLLRFQEFLKDDFPRIKENNRRFSNVGTALANGISIILTERPGEELLDKLKWREGLYREKWNKSMRQPTTNLITQAACTMSEGEDIKCIIAASTSGRTVRMLSRLRPSMIIIGAAHDVINTRKLAASYGVLPICIGEASKGKGTDDIFTQCLAKRDEDDYLRDLLEKGDTVIFTAGTRLGVPGTTNLLQMRRIDEDD